MRNASDTALLTNVLADLPRHHVRVAATARTLVDVFTATARSAPARVAIDAPDRSLTYAELAAAATGVAAMLRRRGIGPGDRVGVSVASGTADLYVAILGVLTAGAAYVPVDSDDPPARAEEMWRASNVCAVISDELAVSFRKDGTGAERTLTVGDDAWVIFTSGSTGRPNGVVVSHRSAAAFIDAEFTLWTVFPEDRVLAGLSVGFDASCEEMWLAWRNGATLVPAPRALVRSGIDLGPWLAARGVTVISTVPTLAGLWDAGVWDHIRLVILGGEACPQELGWRLAAGREVWNTYGPTEATVVTTAARVRPGEPVTIGWPLPGWDVAVVDDAGRRVPAGEAGELVIAGVGLGQYLDRELDARRFARLDELGWARAYRTGDVVRETSGGLEFLGRMDDQIKVGGRRLELGEIETRLASAPGVRAAAAAVRMTPAGNSVLVGYVVGDVDPSRVRTHLGRWLPEGVLPTVVVLDTLPTRASGKVDRGALPWPPPSTDGERSTELPRGTPEWLAERWVEQLGPQPLRSDAHFFELGGTSLAVAKLVSRLRERFPSVGVADVYRSPRLLDLASRLDELGEARAPSATAAAAPRRGWMAGQLAGVGGLLVLTVPSWLISILAFNDVAGVHAGPHVSWLWLAIAWIGLVSTPGRAAMLLLVRRVLLGRVRPGRYPRYGSVGLRLWLVERLADLCHVNSLAGTPWAARYARLLGAEIGPGARLAAMPPMTGLLTVGEGATVEADVDLHGWWIDGPDVVIGEVRIGRGARVGSRTLLLPGADIGAGAEIEPGSVVGSAIPENERWAGSPAAYDGRAGEGWPVSPPEPSAHRRFWRSMYGVGMGIRVLVPLLAAAPGFLIIVAIGSAGSPGAEATAMLVAAPLIAASFIVAYALLVALCVRAVSPLIRPGWRSDDGGLAWGLWLGEGLTAAGRDGPLFPLFSSVYVRSWLRLLGVRVGGRTEVATATGLNRLVTFGEKSFAADDVLFATARARDGWLHVGEVTIGDGSFLGNGAVLRGTTRVGDESLVGVLTTAPIDVADGTSWLGAPPLELPRIADRVDPRRTVDPSKSLILARGLVELIRLLLPASASVALAALVFLALDTVARRFGIAVAALVAPAILLAAGLAATAMTVAVKWLLMGRYRSGDHALWSFFVWRDEIVNSCQEQLAGVWLLNTGLGTPIVSTYLRAMGARVGRRVWCETLAITEFDLVELGDGCVLNRGSCVQTHLFHDRLMRIGPCSLGSGSTLGPNTAILPDAAIGADCSVGGRSVVLRGEHLPAHTRWHGAPVVPV